MKCSNVIFRYVPPMITFFVLLTEIVLEKENRLRLGMRMMGLKNSVYWITWFVQGLVVVTISILFLQAAGTLPLGNKNIVQICVCMETAEGKKRKRKKRKKKRGRGRGLLFTKKGKDKKENVTASL